MKLLPLLAFVPPIAKNSDICDLGARGNLVLNRIAEASYAQPKLPSDSRPPIRVNSGDQLAALAAQSCCIDIEPADVNFTDMKALRASYESLVKSLDSLKVCLEGHGHKKPMIARVLFDKRRQIALAFKKKMPVAGLKEVLDRNREKYGDRLGLTWQKALEKYNNDFDVIIQKACQTNGADLKHLLAE